MSTPAIARPAVGFPPRSLAKIAGVFEAVEGLTSARGQVVVPGRLIAAAGAASAAAEIPLQLWLIIVGLNADRWKGQAGAAADS